ncbi:hypothetical protein HZC30_05710 [Candidatus Woesearchaeota archaeon]|nr:hypothetical protein [Candidatus Woesearchaeota archaeon]
MADIQSQRIMFFDTGPVISLVMSRLMWLIPELKKQYGGKFYITPAVRLELVERPLSVKRFEFEALQVLKLINDGVFEVYNKVPKASASKLISLANSSFKINGKNMDVMQSGEIESVACALDLGAEAVVMDERTLRLFIENSSQMQSLLERRFKSEVTVNNDNIQQFSQMLKKISIIRSVELVAVAFKLGLLDQYVPPEKNGASTLLDSVLWATKFNGCAVTDDEIDEAEKFLLR